MIFTIFKGIVSENDVVCHTVISHYSMPTSNRARCPQQIAESIAAIIDTSQFPDIIV